MARRPAVALDRSYDLSYLLRGPEWAIAIPRGDLDVLDWVMRRCSTFWNGVGTLLLPVDQRGRLPKRQIELFTGVRPVDRVFVHEQLSESAFDAVASTLPNVSRLWERF